MHSSVQLMELKHIKNEFDYLKLKKIENFCIGTNQGYKLRYKTVKYQKFCFINDGKTNLN